jgi:hypothetical protein
VHASVREFFSRRTKRGNVVRQELSTQHRRRLPGRTCRARRLEGADVAERKIHRTDQGAAAHIFKIYDDKIHEIEAMGFTLPLYSKNGWNPLVK